MGGSCGSRRGCRHEGDPSYHAVGEAFERRGGRLRLQESAPGADAESVGPRLELDRRPVASGTPCSRASRRCASQDLRDERPRRHCSDPDVERRRHSLVEDRQRLQGARRAIAATSQPPSGASDRRPRRARARSSAGSRLARPPSAESKTAGSPSSDGKATRPRRAGPEHDRRRPARPPSRPPRPPPDPSARRWSTRTRPTPGVPRLLDRQLPGACEDRAAAARSGRRAPPSRSVSVVTRPSARDRLARRLDPLEPVGKRRDAKGRAPAASNQSRWSASADARAGHAHPGAERRGEPSQVVEPIAEHVRHAVWSFDYGIRLDRDIRTTRLRSRRSP